MNKSSGDWTEVEKSSMNAVDELVESLISRDAKRIANAFTPDATLTIGQVGKLPVPKPVDLSELSNCTKIEIEVNKCFASGPIVMIDHTDTLVWADRVVRGRWIGICSVTDGKIAEFIEFTIDREEVH